MQNQNEIHYRLFPVLPWFAGIVFLGVAIFNYPKDGFSAGTVLAGIVGLASLLLPGALFITADRTEGTLVVELLSLTLIGSTKKFRFDEIAALRLGKKKVRGRPKRSKRKRLYAYRIEIVLKNGEITPLRNAFSSGDGEKQKEMVEQLSAFIGCAAEIPSLSAQEE